MVAAGPYGVGISAAGVACGACSGLSNSGTVIYEDNKGCRDGSKNFGSAAGRAKHMGVRKNFVQAHVNIG